MWKSLLFRAAVSSLTDATAAHSASTRHVRRPAHAKSLEVRSRRKKRSRDRAHLLASKEAEVQQSVSSVSDARDILTAQLADSIFSRDERHVATATHMGFLPDGNPAMPLVALAGRCQCGKTSLLRSLFRSSSEVGKSNRQLRRDAMNFFNVGDTFNIVDLPGVGGTSVPWSAVLQHAVLLRNFVRCQPSLKMLYYCMDVHYKNGVYIQDMDMLSFLSKEVPNFTIVLTKADQLHERDENTARLADIKKELVYNGIEHPVLVTSAFKMGGMDTLRFDMVSNVLHALPTERLTLTEARRLSQRLLSQGELATLRPLPIAPTLLDEEKAAWDAMLQLERPAVGDLSLRGGGEEVAPGPNEAAETAALEGQSFSPSAAEGEAVAQHEKECDEEMFGTPLVDSWRASSAALAVLPASSKVSLQEQSYAAALRVLENKSHLDYVRSTSPWRNPLLWPQHIVPTKHPKANIVRCPQDPTNPYLFQAQFVAPRADMQFRRPNVGVRRSGQKGKYEADRPLRYLVKQYTIPYFPDIVDVEMQPQPWAFLGSREAYYERGDGRRLGIRMKEYATQGEVRALSDSPAPGDPELTKEIRALEAKRYGAPIAMLRPPSDAPQGLALRPSRQREE